MSLLQAGCSLENVAAVLGAAARTGRAAWTGRRDPAERSMTDETRTQILADLFAQLRAAGVDHVLVGGIAMLRYVDGRNTDDIDLIVGETGLARVAGLVIADRNAAAARATFEGMRVDLLFTSHPVFRLVSERHVTDARFGEVSIRCATVQGLVVLKLFALPRLYRDGDLARAALYETDILMLMQRHRPDVDAALAELATYVTSAELHELRSIVADLQARLVRMARASGS